MVAVTTSLFNGFVYPHLSELGISDPSHIVETHSQGGTGISPEVWSEARQVLSQGYSRQMFALVACGVAQAAVALLAWQKKKAKSSGDIDESPRDGLIKTEEHGPAKVSLKLAQR